MLSIRSIVIVTAIGVMLLQTGNEVKLIVADEGVIPRRQQANLAELARQARVASRTWKKPRRRWPGRLY